MAINRSKRATRTWQALALLHIPSGVETQGVCVARTTGAAATAGDVLVLVQPALCACNQSILAPQSSTTHNWSRQAPSSLQYNTHVFNRAEMPMTTPGLHLQLVITVRAVEFRVPDASGQGRQGVLPLVGLKVSIGQTEQGPASRP